MDEFRERMARIFNFIRNWCEFGLLLVLNAILNLIQKIIVIILLVLPTAYLIFASQQPVLVSLYLLAVFGGVAAHEYFQTNTAGDQEDPHKNRPINSKYKAIGKSIEQDTSR